MKTLTTLALLLLTSMAHANTRYDGRIECSGTATIAGTFSTKSLPVGLSFNVSNGGASQIAQLGNKTYLHAEETSWCENSGIYTVTCYGRGLGNGPELTVVINLSNMTASGTYFNVDAERIEVPNEYNTYTMNNLTCSR